MELLSYGMTMWLDIVILGRLCLLLQILYLCNNQKGIMYILYQLCVAGCVYFFYPYTVNKFFRFNFHFLWEVGCYPALPQPSPTTWCFYPFYIWYNYFYFILFFYMVHMRQSALMKSTTSISFLSIPKAKCPTKCTNFFFFK